MRCRSRWWTRYGGTSRGSQPALPQALENVAGPAQVRLVDHEEVAVLLELPRAVLPEPRMGEDQRSCGRPRDDEAASPFERSVEPIAREG